ncbi:hypothetical protein L1987_70702 [Smallanthus sonchifolius]|uniref:Uncharacterized protein n=1 Tax=Smallanthus sonchifolius TaxID=185202 RepID=A0ACB9AQQ3_9ASTR|nr:hypothetical protein L1987_70702 [Smallanthus sonchifolius]
MPTGDQRRPFVPICAQAAQAPDHSAAVFRRFNIPLFYLKQSNYRFQRLHHHPIRGSHIHLPTVCRQCRCKVHSSAIACRRLIPGDHQRFFSGTGVGNPLRRPSKTRNADSFPSKTSFKKDEMRANLTSRLTATGGNEGNGM